MEKKKLIIVMMLCGLIFLTLGCTKKLLIKKYLGKPLPPELSKYQNKLQNSGHHFLKWPKMDIVYDYQINSATQSATTMKEQILLPSISP